MDPIKDFRCLHCGSIINDFQQTYGADSPCPVCQFEHSIVIDSPDFPYINYGGAEFSTIVFTFDVDKESTLYKFMKSRLRYAPFKIEIRGSNNE